MKLDIGDYWWIDTIIEGNINKIEQRKKLEERAEELTQELNAMVLNMKIDRIKNWEKDSQSFQDRLNEYEKSFSQKIENTDDKTKDYVKTLEQNCKDEIAKMKTKVEKITKDRQIEIDDVDELINLREKHFNICADYFKEIIKISNDIDLNKKIKEFEDNFNLKEKPNIFDKIGLKIKKAQAKIEQESMMKKEIEKNGLLLTDFLRS